MRAHGNLKGFLSLFVTFNIIIMEHLLNGVSLKNSDPVRGVSLPVAAQYWAQGATDTFAFRPLNFLLPGTKMRSHGILTSRHATSESLAKLISSGQLDTELDVINTLSSSGCWIRANVLTIKLRLTYAADLDTNLVEDCVTAMSLGRLGVAKLTNQGFSLVKNPASLPQANELTASASVVDEIVPEISYIVTADAGNPAVATGVTVDILFKFDISKMTLEQAFLGLNDWVFACTITNTEAGSGNPYHALTSKVIVSVDGVVTYFGKTTPQTSERWDYCGAGGMTVPLASLLPQPLSAPVDDFVLTNQVAFRYDRSSLRDIFIVLRLPFSTDDYAVSHERVMYAYIPKGKSVVNKKATAVDVQRTLGYPTNGASYVTVASGARTTILAPDLTNQFGLLIAGFLGAADVLLKSPVVTWGHNQTLDMGSATQVDTIRKRLEANSPSFSHSSVFGNNAYVSAETPGAVIIIVNSLYFIADAGYALRLDQPNQAVAFDSNIEIWCPDLVEAPIPYAP